MAMNLQTPTTSYICQTHQAMKSDESTKAHRKMETGPGSSLSKTRGMRGALGAGGTHSCVTQSCCTFCQMQKNQLKEEDDAGAWLMKGQLRTGAGWKGTAPV